jgi:predicted HicB family RNase H-like nuclease
MTKKKQIDPVPEVFKSYEEAAEFWDTHDTTDYPEFFSPVEVEAVLKSKHLEVEIDPSVMEALRLRAKQQGVPIGQLANELLKKQLETIAP